LKPETIKLVVGLVLAIALDTAVQLFWKMAALRMPDSISSWASIEVILQEPLFLVVAILLAAQFVNWLTVLNQADLSYSQPITSLSYVSVCVLSTLYLDETVGLLQLAGIALIFVGVWFIARTERVSEPVRILIP
jgi:drug/metabolite transporter (DMT)-like permease